MFLGNFCISKFSKQIRILSRHWTFNINFSVILKIFCSFKSVFCGYVTKMKIPWKYRLWWDILIFLFSFKNLLFFIKVMLDLRLSKISEKCKKWFYVNVRDNCWLKYFRIFTLVKIENIKPSTVAKRTLHTERCNIKIGCLYKKSYSDGSRILEACFTETHGYKIIDNITFFIIIHSKKSSPF